jgi:hypothetical protein
MRTAVRRDPSLTVREIEGEVLVLDRRSNRVHQFNGTASFIWRRCAEGLPAEAIAEALAREYEVSDEVARRDVGAFLEHLGGLGLLERE